MADVFGDPVLFGEFEKDRSYADDRSKRCVGEARAFLSTLCSPLQHNTLATEKELKVSGDTRTDIGSATSNRKNFPDVASAMEYIQKLESEIQKLKKINDKLLLEKGPTNPKSFEMSVDGPAVQVHFMNDAVARKYRLQVENCLKDIFSQDTEESFRERKMPCASEVVGKYQYFKGFVLDVSGWPLPDHSSAMIDSENLPKYEQVFRQPLPCEQSKDKETPEVIVKEKRAKAACFNCGGDHNVSACMEKRDQQRINLARRQFMDKFSPAGNCSNPGKQRYHIEDDPRFSEMMPGAISDALRDALGISSQQLPPYIYQMRVLGYPPGHLENAKQSTSGLTMFDKHGQELTSDGELLEDGEVNEAFVQSPEYNFDKLVDYPGFNVGLPPGIIDESQQFGMPPMQPKWGKDVMKDFLFKKQKMTDNAKRKHDDSSYGDVGSKCLKTGVELETTVDMDIEETTGDEISAQSLASPWPIVSIPAVNMHPPPPPPPPPLPEDAEEELPPLPLDPSPAGSSSSALEFGAELLVQPSTASEAESETTATAGIIDSSSNLSANNEKDLNTRPDSAAEPPTAVQATKIVTPVGGRFGGSRSFCLGTPVALEIDDDSPSVNCLPDSSKFASGVSDLILHDNLPNATGTFNKLKVVLSDVKIRSNSPCTNALMKR